MPILLGLVSNFDDLNLLIAELIRLVEIFPSHRRIKLFWRSWILSLKLEMLSSLELLYSALS